MSLDGRTILMSGGSRGIGLAIALRAARDGANIAFLAKTDAPHPRLEGTVFTAADAVVAAGGQAHPIVGDVRRDDDITRAVSETVERFGGIDMVVNNASVIDLSGTADLAEKKYDLMQDVNVRGTFMLTRAALPHLLESDDARVLSLSPPLNPTPRWLGAHTGYSLAKFGMTMATLGIAAEFGGRGVSAATLWPRTTIATAAVRNVIGGDRLMALSRTPEICADAAHAVLTLPADQMAGRSLIVEDVLADMGVTDLSGYAAVPGTDDDDLFPDIFLD
ncbi:NAD(P)-dependent oxidoreductase [Demequina sp. NBRC 110051]|uniref:SDR family oxidoreductase n=1 Tax=Demequina sp. NBRC 110051 TaxID=1570340 RepID=UPI000A05DA8B|nr:NAD(P)-dependent oxidoreductase [Demequina sp. NBRC 110051]